MIIKDRNYRNMHIFHNLYRKFESYILTSALRAVSKEYQYGIRHSGHRTVWYDDKAQCLNAAYNLLCRHDGKFEIVIRQVWESVMSEPVLFKASPLFDDDQTFQDERLFELYARTLRERGDKDAYECLMSDLPF